MTTAPIRLVCLGGGNMAQALLSGCLITLESVVVIEPLAETRLRLEALLRPLALAHSVRLEVLASLDGLETEPPADWLLLAVKPQQVEEALRGLNPANHPSLKTARLLSVVAGLSSLRLATLSGLSEIVRAMPNTPALIGEGMTGLFATSNCSSAAREEAETVMRAVGQVAWFEEEGLMDAVTALSGSGPAYLFRFVEALTRAGGALGLDAQIAQQMATQTMKGAALMLTQSTEGPSVLRERVTSKGGTTAAALAVFDEHLDGLTLRALQAAHDRSQALARGD